MTLPKTKFCTVKPLLSSMHGEWGVPGILKFLLIESSYFQLAAEQWGVEGKRAGGGQPEVE